MTKNNTYTPLLRFPEFVKDSEWQSNSLGENYRIHGGFAFQSKYFGNQGIPVIRISNIPIDGVFIDIQDCVYYHTINNENDFIARQGDLLIAMSGATTGKTAIYNYSIKAYINQRVGIFRSVSKKNYYPFIYQWVNTHNFRKQLNNILTSGAQPNISSIDIESLNWAYPNYDEQQKIAECLSSLDDYISATQTKLQLLQEYKKGLLQQLFPTHYKMTPKFRFSEFKDAGEWSKMQLGDLINCDSSQLSLSQLDFHSHGYPVYGADGLVGYLSSFMQNKNYISIVKDGSGVGRVSLCKKQSSVLGTLNYLTSKNEKLFNLEWIYYLLQSINFSNYVKGSSIPHIYYSDYNKHIVLVPDFPEQKKIADCLSSLDKQIGSIKNIIAMLQMHKKALQQQLFPKI